MQTKIDERFEKAVNAFFEPVTDDAALAKRYGTDEIAVIESEPISQTADRWLTIARQVFLFVPGAFLLYFSVLSTIFFFPQMGLTLQMVLMMLSGAFLTLAGVGDIRNTKNLTVPATIAGFGAAFAIIASLFPLPSQADLYFWYSIYLFPIALIIAAAIKPRPQPTSSE
jgi:hypothetical protein